MGEDIKITPSSVSIENHGRGVILKINMNTFLLNRFRKLFVLVIIMFSYGRSASATNCDFSWTQIIPVSASAKAPGVLSDLASLIEQAVSACDRKLNNMFFEIGQVCYDACKRRGEYCVSNAHQSSSDCTYKIYGTNNPPPIPSYTEVVAEGSGSLTCTCTGS